MKKQLATALAMILLAGSSMAETDYSQQNEKRTTPHRPTVPMTFQNYQRKPTMTYRSDSDLQTMARRSLERDNDISFEAKNVNVKVRDGRASIQGFVNSPEDSDALKRKVMAIDGVRSVNNRVSIQE